MIAECTVIINAKPADVWKAITTPALIKKYLMGTEVISDWTEGSAINYMGEYNGKKYHDKGVIKKVGPGHVFESTYWSSMGGKEDKPENYNTVTYVLTSHHGGTLVTLTQDNIATENEKQQMITNWTGVLTKLKEVVENG